MKFIYVSLFFAFILISCSSKEEIKINDKINSFSLDKDIVIAYAPKRVEGPISIGLGIGGYVSKHVGIYMGTSVRPKVSNTKALILQKAMALNNISLSELIKNETIKQLKEDNYYKNKFVSFGANYTLHLFVPRYYLDEATFSSKAQVKIIIRAIIYNNKNEIIYETTKDNSIVSRNLIYDKNEIINSKNILKKVLNQAIQNCIKKIIIQMKKS